METNEDFRNESGREGFDRRMKRSLSAIRYKEADEDIKSSILNCIEELPDALKKYIEYGHRKEAIN